MAQTFTICAQHADFVVINKPAGVSVHKDLNEMGLTEQLARQLNVAQVWLVHRLDQATSGLLILALTPKAAAIFGELFATHQIQKTYLALATHKPKKKQGSVIGDMQKTRNGCWKLCHTKTNPAITRFTSHALAPNLRLFELAPQTGKTHQLRVMMKSLGSPILGDTRYGGDTADRLYLHAHRLQFTYQGEPFDLTAPPEGGEKWALLPNA